MNRLTGNEDTDFIIFDLLTLSDVENFTSTNKYINHLLSRKVMKANNQAIESLNPQSVRIDSSEPYHTFLILMKQLNILPAQLRSVDNNTSRLKITIFKATPGDYTNFILKEDYIIGYYLYNDIKHIARRERYYGSKNKIIKFLTHIYYDHLYDNITFG